jgi:hypothetical protein
MVSCFWVKEVLEPIVAARSEAFDAGKFGQPPRRAAPSEDGDQVDRLGDHRAGHGDDGFLDKLFEAA